MVTYEGNNFCWVRGAGYADASTLSSTRLPEVFIVQSHRTGTKKLFALAGTDGSGWVTESWLYRSSDGVTIRIWND